MENLIPETPEHSSQFVTLAEGTTASDYALKRLSASLGKAQDAFQPAVKEAENKYHGYDYTPLIAIIKAVRPALTKEHLTVSQFPRTDLERKTVTLYTRIVHWDSGEWMQNELELPAELALGKDGALKFNQQTIGGSQTYAMKYAYKAILGIADSEEVVDANQAETGNVAPQPKPAARAAEPHPASGAPATDRTAQAGFLGSAAAINPKWNLTACRTLLEKLFGHAVISKLTKDQIERALGECHKGDPDKVLAAEGTTL